MNKLFFLIAVFGIVCYSCTKEKTDYESEVGTGITDNSVFKEAYSSTIDEYRVTIYSLNGELFNGFNDLQLKISTIKTNKAVQATAVTFLPIFSDTDGIKTCPHSYNLSYNSLDDYYSAYAVFNQVAQTAGSWKLYISFTVDNKIFHVVQDISVGEQLNKNLNFVSFKALDDQVYLIALKSPIKPQVGENKIFAGIYKYTKSNNSPIETNGGSPDFIYTPVEGYTLKLDPRMPEPSMGNHTSPNNRDLIQQEDGFYHGIVNYTMSGDWTLNLILINPQGRILKGTVVPSDFTPGVEGVKSELYLDILF